MDLATLAKVGTARQGHAGSKLAFPEDVHVRGSVDGVCQSAAGQTGPGVSAEHAWKGVPAQCAFPGPEGAVTEHSGRSDLDCPLDATSMLRCPLAGHQICILWDPSFGRAGRARSIGPEHWGKSVLSTGCVHRAWYPHHSQL